MPWLMFSRIGLMMQKKELKEKNDVDVPEENCFLGFDGYQKVLDSGVDIVILATPPHFRAQQLEAAVKAKKYYEETPGARDKCCERGKAVWKRPEHKTNILDAKGQNKPFDVFTIDGTFIKTFTYQFEAIEYLQTEHNITSTIKIGEVLRGTRNNSAGFVFKYQK